jgi:hypothetical protein
MDPICPPRRRAAVRKPAILIIGALLSALLAACTTGTIGGISGDGIASDNVMDDAEGQPPSSGRIDIEHLGEAPDPSLRKTPPVPEGINLAGGEPGGDEPGGDEPGGDMPGGDNPGGDPPGDPYADCIGWRPVPDGWKGTIKDICGKCEVANGKRCAYVGGAEIYLHCTVDNTVVIPPEGKYENFNVANCSAAPTYDYVIWDSIQCVAPTGAPYNPCVY